MAFDVEIVQPVYNPSENWVEEYALCYRELKQLFTGINFRIIFVNDGSQKNFNDKVLMPLHDTIENLKIISYSDNRGKGYAVREGVKQTEADFVLYTDYDFPYEMKCLRHAYQQLNAGNDVVVGIRNKKYYEHLGVKRKIVSKACNFLNKVFLRIPHEDTQSGLKGFSKKGKKIMLETTIDDFLFDTEFVCKAYQTKSIKVATVNVELREGAKFTNISTKTIFRETRNFFYILWSLYTGKFK